MLTIGAGLLIVFLCSKVELDYVYNMVTKVVMDSMGDTGQWYATDLLNKTFS